MVSEPDAPPEPDPASAPDSPLAPDELVSTGTEREVLDAFLDLYRAVVVRKVSGLSEEQLRRRHVPSATTLAGIVRHLTAVERGWFQRRLGQYPEGRLDANTGGDDASWELGPDDSIGRLLADYEAACAESRRIAAAMALDEAVPHPRLGRVSLRWVMVHMIEETARHAGHADILRELTDGATGFDG
jgi:uncharacterized damage-inducible protein DinB